MQSVPWKATSCNDFKIIFYNSYHFEQTETEPVGYWNGIRVKIG